MLLFFFWSDYICWVISVEVKVVIGQGLEVVNTVVAVVFFFFLGNFEFEFYNTNWGFSVRIPFIGPPTCCNYFFGKPCSLITFLPKKDIWCITLTLVMASS